ncbi:probable cationic amino acid transporter [Lingula anatina]|uniref:Probable cationic amino acid transporter n=1 Tax=Lingula anatina TaxID=7574 RepID=A0A1S3IBV3_LINAN|nr:probable cationic amino acid transporter [Lingula anatina]|eukprot:XP_013395722.1 probable cationic amino acid transporter [Lingula anatina]
MDSLGLEAHRARVNDLREKMTRTKTIQEPDHDHDDGDHGGSGDPAKSGFKRCLTTLDLTSLGVGSCCGTGMYVVAGLVARDVAGPGVIISFAIAAIASILSGVCYAEFGVRVPKTTGSAYMYSYVTVGEFIAFVIGWNLILEYMIGSAAGACALSACLDALTNHTVSTYMAAHLAPVIERPYPDFVAFFIGFVMTCVLAGGVSKSVMFNNILNAINIAVWVFIVICGLFYVDSKNWTQNGFMPYGFKGVLSGAATCFYAFIGFDIIATTGEEARNPSRSIPIAIVGSLFTCLTAYVSVSVILTLMLPYFMINGDSALVDMFVQRGALDAAKYVVAFGSICALTVSLLGSMFPMPRVIYAMARDGLLFEFLERINSRTKTPLLATIVSGVLASFIAMLVGLSTLVQMMSIGTLMAYTLVSISILILRYQPDTEVVVPQQVDGPDLEYTAGRDPDFGDGTRQKYKDDEFLLPSQGDGKSSSYGSVPFEDDMQRLGWFKRNCKLIKMHLGIPGDEAEPSDRSARIVIITVAVMFLVMIMFCLLVDFGGEYIIDGAAWAIILAIVLLLVIAAGVFTILRQPMNRRKFQFMAPAVPYLPAGAMFINIYLMLKLPPLTWARLGVWLLVGFLIYFLYSIHNSKKGKNMLEKQKLQEMTAIDHPQSMTNGTVSHAEDHVHPNGITHAQDEAPKYMASNGFNHPGGP